jgi:hypothetical protein
MAVTRFGGTMDLAARHFLETHGFEPDKDIVLIQIGSSADVVPAMTNGLAQSEVMSVPYLFIACRLGVRELADLSQTGVPTRKRRWSRSGASSRTSVKLLDSLSDRRSRRSVILRRNPLWHADLGSVVRTDDADILKQAFDYYVHKLLSPAPDIRPDDIKLLLDEAALTSVKAKGVNPRDLIDEGPARGCALRFRRSTLSKVSRREADNISSKKRWTYAENSFVCLFMVPPVSRWFFNRRRSAQVRRATRACHPQRRQRIKSIRAHHLDQRLRAPAGL